MKLLFQVTQVIPVDDDNYLQKGTVGLGEVKLVLSYATFGPESNKYCKYDPVGKVHEKSKKATGHKVEYASMLLVLLLCLTQSDEV